MDKPTLDKIEALAGRGLSEQQIADALDIDIEKTRADMKAIATYRQAIRRGKPRGLQTYRTHFTSRPRKATREP